MDERERARREAAQAARQLIRAVEKLLTVSLAVLADPISIQIELTRLNEAKSQIHLSKEAFDAARQSLVNVSQSDHSPSESEAQKRQGRGDRTA